MYYVIIYKFNLKNFEGKLLPCVCKLYGRGSGCGFCGYSLHRSTSHAHIPHQFLQLPSNKIKLFEETFQTFYYYN